MQAGLPSDTLLSGHGSGADRVRPETSSSAGRNDGPSRQDETFSGLLREASGRVGNNADLPAAAKARPADDTPAPDGTEAAIIPAATAAKPAGADAPATPVVNTGKVQAASTAGQKSPQTGSASAMPAPMQQAAAGAAPAQAQTTPAQVASASAQAQPAQTAQGSVPAQAPTAQKAPGSATAAPTLTRPAADSNTDTVQSAGTPANSGMAKTDSGSAKATEAGTPSAAAQATVSPAATSGTANKAQPNSRAGAAPNAGNAKPDRPAIATGQAASANPGATAQPGTPQQAGAPLPAESTTPAPLRESAQPRAILQPRQGGSSGAKTTSSATGSAITSAAANAAKPDLQVQSAQPSDARPDPSVMPPREQLFTMPQAGQPGSAGLAMTQDAVQSAQAAADADLATQTEADLQLTRTTEIRAGMERGTANLPRFAAHGAQQLAGQITRQFNNGNRVFDIRLDPAELGKVDVRLELRADNRVHAVLTAERPETLAELQRAARDLERALNEAGLDLAEEGLTFQMNEDGQAASDDDGRGQSLPIFAEGDVTVADGGTDVRMAPQSTYGFLLARREGVDMRV